jgi:hypothetical protein
VTLGLSHKSVTANVDIDEGENGKVGPGKQR